MFYFICVNERRLSSSDNDIYYDDINKCVARNTSFVDSAAQKIKSTIQTFLGECFADRGVGVEWYDRILGQDILAVDAAKAELKETIQSIGDVAEVKNIKANINGRNTQFEYTVVLTDGSEVKDFV